MSNIEVEFDICKETQCLHVIKAVMKAGCKLPMKSETAVSIE